MRDFHQTFYRGDDWKDSVTAREFSVAFRFTELSVDPDTGKLHRTALANVAAVSPITNGFTSSAAAYNSPQLPGVTLFGDAFETTHASFISRIQETR